MGDDNGVSVHYIIAVVAPDEGDEIPVEDNRDDHARVKDQRPKIARDPLRPPEKRTPTPPRGLGWDDKTTPTSSAWDDKTTPKQNRPSKK